MTTIYLKANNPISGVQAPLQFQYTPTIEYSHDVKYDAYQLTHTNYQPNAYSRSENPQINITAKFSAHTVEHFKASEYALRFLRTYSKMNYGRKDNQKGQPPRILRFFAYGSPVFNNVPVVISKFNMTFPDDVDYILGVYDNKGRLSSTFNGGSRTGPRTPEKATNEETGEQYDPVDPAQVPLYLPALFTVSISLLVNQNSYQTVTTFDLEKFSQGALSYAGYI